MSILYNSWIESIIRYCIVVWGGTFSNTLHILQTAQNTLLKIIFKKSKLFSTSLLYKELKQMSVRSIYIQQSLIWVFSNSSKLKINQHQKYTRTTQQLLVKVPFFSKTITKRSLFYYGPTLFNLLPKNIKTIINYKQFKRTIKNMILTKTIEFNIF